MKLKIAVIFIFLLIYGIFLYINTELKNERIQFDLNQQVWSGNLNSYSEIKQF